MDQKDKTEGQAQIPEDPPVPIATIPSSLYSQFFKQSRQMIKDLQSQLEQSNFYAEIYMNTSKQYQDLSIKIIEHSFDRESITVAVEYGKNIITLSILLVQGESPAHTIADPITNGQFGAIYRTKLQDQEIGIKCQKIQKNKTKSDLAFNVIRQYALLFIASNLKAGPNLPKIESYNLIIYLDCIQFSMQYCKKDFDQEGNENDLKIALYSLHSHNILHCDIKPDNIAYSKTYNKYVFIDFGLSEIAKQKIGEKARRSFKGSFQYCSPQYKNSYYNQQQQYLDAFYNDVHCLKTSFGPIDSIKKKNKQNNIGRQKIDEQIQQNIEVQLRYLLYNIKFYLYHHLVCDQKLYSLLRKQKPAINQHFLPDIQRIIKHIPCSAHLKQTYSKFFLNLRQKQISWLSLRPYMLFSLRKKEQYKCNEKIQQIYKQTWNINLKDEKEQMEQFLSTMVNSKLHIQKQKDFFLFNASKIINITSFKYNFQQKMLICEKLSGYFSINKNVSRQQLLKSCINWLFNYSFSLPNNQQKCHILKELVISTAILEIKSQSQFLQLFDRVLKMQIGFVDKLSIVLNYLAAAEWIKYRVIGKYDRKKVDCYLWKSIFKYYRAITSCDSQIEQKYLIIFDFIGRVKTNSSNLIKALARCSFIKQLSKSAQNIPPNNRKLFNDLNSYLASQIYTILRDAFSWRLYHILQYLQYNLQRALYEQKYQNFTYLHLLMASQYYDKPSIYQFNQISNLYTEMFHNFNFYQQFSLYYFLQIKMNRLQQINQKQLQQSFSGLNKFYALEQLKYSEILLKEEFKQSNISRNMILANLADQPWKRWLRQILTTNHQNQITTVHNMNLQIRRVISSFKSIINIDLLAFQQLGQSKIKQKVNSCCQFSEFSLKLLQKVNCFHCKMLSLMQLTSIKNVILYYQQKWQLLFLSFLKFLIFCIKNGTININQRIIFDYQMLLQNDDYRNVSLMLYHQFIKHFQCYRLYLKDNIFGKIYYQLFLLDNFKQLEKMINNITETILNERDNKTILSVNADLFYNQFTYVIEEECVNQSQKQYFICKHIDFFKIWKKASNPYIGLYFNALVKYYRGQIPTNWIYLEICYMLNILDEHSRRLILNTLYTHNINPLNTEIRKNSFFQKRHLKNTNQKYSISQWNKILIYPHRETVKNRKKYEGLQKCVKNYRLNIKNNKKIK